MMTDQTFSVIKDASLKQTAFKIKIAGNRFEFYSIIPVNNHEAGRSLC